MPRPEDLRFPFEYDGAGDAATVTDNDFYYRHALQLALIVQETLSGSPSTSNDVLEFEEDIKGALESSPFFDAPVSVDVETEDDGETVTASVGIQNIGAMELPLE